MVPEMMPLEIYQQTLYPPDNMLLYATPVPETALAASIPYSESLSSRRQWRSLESLRGEIHRLFLNSLTTARMLAMSRKMRSQYRRQLQEGQDCMLPSYSTTLPTGQEKGTCLALDVGGSTLRLALVDLNGRSHRMPLHIRRMVVAPIGSLVRKMPSHEFFDWIAQRIEAMLLDEPGVETHGQKVWLLGLTWSFPLDQTSLSGGRIRGMGKGFRCHHDTLGQDLGELIVNACRARSVNVRIEAIVNDSSATLLSQAYLDSSTSMGLIVGTGTNAAIHLPTCSLALKKFGIRNPAWYSGAEKVITNTELSMFGKGILPETRWDEVLNAAHPLPDFQPLEYMTTGRYLGEILRLIIVEAVDTCGLFDGILPQALNDPYTLETLILAKLEQDPSPNYKYSSTVVQEAWQLPRRPRRQEMQFLRSAAQDISHRSSAFLAVAIHALWSLQKEFEPQLGSVSDRGSTSSIACNGSVILKYPAFRQRCQDFIADMVQAESGATHPPGVTDEVVLQSTDEAAILGAAVAVILAEEEPTI